MRTTETAAAGGKKELPAAKAEWVTVVTGPHPSSLSHPAAKAEWVAVTTDSPRALEPSHTHAQGRGARGDAGACRCTDESRDTHWACHAGRRGSAALASRLERDGTVGRRGGTVGGRGGTVGGVVHLQCQAVGCARVVGEGQRI